MEYLASHPNLDMLELHLLGHLEQEETETLGQHLTTCAPCREMTDKLAEQIQIIRESMLATQ